MQVPSALLHLAISWICTQKRSGCQKPKKPVRDRYGGIRSGCIFHDRCGPMCFKALFVAIRLLPDCWKQTTLLCLWEVPDLATHHIDQLSEQSVHWFLNIWASLAKQSDDTINVRGCEQTLQRVEKSKSSPLGLRWAFAQNASASNFLVNRGTCTF
jgi:hypothetical protein